MKPATARRAGLALVCLQAALAGAQTSPAPAPSAVPPTPAPTPAPSARSSETDPKEYAVKADFLYNFARFTEWPADAFRDARAPFVIAVLGPDPFGAVLDTTMAGKTVGGRRIEVRRLERTEDAEEAQIVFLPAAGRRDLAATLKALDRPGVLTVGESDGFAEQGGTVNFTVASRQVRFEINPRRAEDAGLKMSSQLLRLATLVPSPHP